MAPDGSSSKSRLSDHRQVTQQTLHDGRLTDPSSLRAVDFRVGRFGRFEWTANGTDLYLQFFPPSLQAMDSPPEFMLQQMARAGVDRAVLQNARPYGRLNEYIAQAVRAYPDKFIGLADVDEARGDDAIARVDDARRRTDEFLHFGAGADQRKSLAGGESISPRPPGVASPDASVDDSQTRHGRGGRWGAIRALTVHDARGEQRRQRGEVNEGPNSHGMNRRD